MIHSRSGAEAESSTLAGALQRLEQQAIQRLKYAAPPYSRALLATESGISEERLSAWLDGSRKPKDIDSLICVVEALTNLCGQGADPPRQQDWRRLLADARKRGDTPRPEPRPSVRLVLRTGAVVAATAAVTTIVGVAVTPVGQFFSALLGFGSASSASSPAATPPLALEGLDASASWCCTDTSVLAKSGYYLPGSAADLDAALHAAANRPGLTPGGVGIVEIPLQTSGTEPIYVGAPQVIVRTRQPNVRTGVIGIVPLGGQGGGAPNQFETDLDFSTPVTVPYSIGAQSAAATAPPQYYYVSNSSPEILLLVVRDSTCDCTFDVKVTWQAQGRQSSSVLTNGGRHFHMVGSSGLPWYSQDGPDLGFTRVTTLTFPAD